MTASVVQTKQGGGSGISGTLNITLTSGTTAGNCLIVIIGNNASNVVPSAITLGGTSLTLDASKTDAGANAAVSFWSLPNIAAGQTAVAITHSATWSPGVTVLEVSGLATSSVFDAATAGGSSSAGSQSSFNSGSASASASSALRLGCCVTFGTSGHTTITPTGSGTWSAFGGNPQGSFTDVACADQLNGGAGTLQYTGTLSPSAADWVALAVSYLGTGGGSPVSVSGAVSQLALAAPQGSVSAAGGATGLASQLALAAPAGVVAAAGGVTGLTGQLALAAPAGVVQAAASVTGLTGQLALAAPAGSVSVGNGVTGLPSALALAAPAGSVSVAAAIAGQVAGLSLSAPAGSVQTGSGVPGIPAGLTLVAPAGSVSAGATVQGVTAHLVLGAPPGAVSGAAVVNPGSVTAANRLAQLVKAANTAPSAAVANKLAQLVKAGNSE